MDETANERVRGTHGQPVRVRWDEEKASLGRRPPVEYDTSVKVLRKVYRDCRIRYNGDGYVVPHHVVGKRVMLKVKHGTIRFFHDDELLVAYPEARGLEKLGKQVVAYLAMCAVEVDPEEAKGLGIVIDVFEDEELLPKCEEIAKRITANSYMAKTFIKTTLNRKAMEEYQEAERFMPTIFATEFMQDAVARFLSKK